MASSSCDDDYQSIGKQCLDICQASVTIGLVVKMSLSIGKAFSFNFCSDTNGNLPLPAVCEKPKKMTKSPATRRRDQTRLTAFRNKKAASPGLPLAPDPSPLDFSEVTTSQMESTMPSSSFDPRSFDTVANVPEDTFDPSVPPPVCFDSSVLPPSNNNYSTNNSLCVCQSVPCVCLASKPLSPKRLPRIKIKKTKSGWISNTSSPEPQLCENCDQPFLNPMHICGEQSCGDENKKIPCEKFSCPGEDILDLRACSDIVFCDLLSDHEKQQALSKNCMCVLSIVPLNLDLAKFCFSHSKFFLLKKDNPSLGLTQYLVNIFDEEFNKQISKHGVI